MPRSNSGRRIWPELLGQHRPAVERLPTGEAHELGVLLEEPERGAKDPLDLGPPLALGPGDGVLDEREPVGEGVEQDRAGTSASFDGKWCSRLGRRMPTSSAISVRLVSW